MLINLIFLGERALNEWSRSTCGRLNSEWLGTSALTNHTQKWFIQDQTVKKYDQCFKLNANFEIKITGLKQIFLDKLTFLPVVFSVTEIVLLKTNISYFAGRANAIWFQNN